MGGEVEDAGHDGDFHAVGLSWVAVSLGEDAEELKAGNNVFDADPKAT